MKAYVGVTDNAWFRFLAGLPNVDEVNFWQPSGGRGFRVLEPGAPFLFKLHAPESFIVGGGFFAGFSQIPASLAWDSFREKNGTSTFDEMVQRISKYTRSAVGPEHVVGCILLEQPFFWERGDWIPEPADWSSNIVQGKSYDLAQPPIGTWLWEQLETRLMSAGLDSVVDEAPASPTFGEPRLVTPRLGQGSFRVLVTDAYDRRCAVTGEKILPVLQAAHIRPVSAEGQHRVDNGLLLRSDVHTLFDRGYLTVTGEYQLRVSHKLKDDFDNGAFYYGLEGKAIRLPTSPLNRPDPIALEWHSDVVFNG